MMTMAELDRQKTALVAGVENWPAAPKEWTVPEIFDHLARTEREIVAIAQQGLSNPHRIGLRDKAGVLFVDYIFRSNRRVKTPTSVKAVVPASDPHLPDVLARWELDRAATSAFVAGVPPEQMRGGIFRHPVAGWMNLADVLNFFSVHMIHHKFQIMRLKVSSDSFASWTAIPEP